MVFNKEDAPILLPKELEDVQFKLNSIKYSALNSERLAREAEQRKNDLVVYLAFPPSPLFVSELMILKQVITDRNWWLVAGLLLLMCIVIYSFGSRLIRLCYQPNQDRLHPSKAHKALSWSALSLLAAAIVLGMWQPELLQRIITEIAAL